MTESMLKTLLRVCRIVMVCFGIPLLLLTLAMGTSPSGPVSSLADWNFEAFSILFRVLCGGFFASVVGQIVLRERIKKLQNDARIAALEEEVERLRDQDRRN